MKKEKRNLNQTINENRGIYTDEYFDIEDEKNNNKGAKSQIDFQNLEYFEFKIILIGEPGVGKTAIMNKFILNEFKSSYQTTLGVEFKVKEIYLDNSACARLKIWDTCGQEKFRSITRQYFKNSNGVFLIFDLTNKITVQKLNIWLKDITENISEDVVIFMIGNKMDIKTRDISISEEAKQFANEKKLYYYEVSAKTGAGIVNIFEKITKKLVIKTKNERNKNEGNIKVMNRNFNIEDYFKDRGKIEQKRNTMHCC